MCIQRRGLARAGFGDGREVIVMEAVEPAGWGTRMGA
jgi:hypothetical protein